MDKLEQYELQFKKAKDSTREISDARAKAEAIFKNLDDLTKTVLASEFGRSHQKTQKEREMAAFASEGYRVHLSGVSVAREAFLLAKSREDNVTTVFEWSRTMISLEKAKIGLR